MILFIGPSSTLVVLTIVPTKVTGSVIWATSWRNKQNVSLLQLSFRVSSTVAFIPFFHKLSYSLANIELSSESYLDISKSRFEVKISNLVMLNDWDAESLCVTSKNSLKSDSALLNSNTKLKLQSISPSMLANVPWQKQSSTPLLFVSIVIKIREDFH